MQVKSPAFRYSQKTTKHFRHTFPSDKEKKIFWQGRDIAKAPWSQQKQAYRSGCIHSEFHSPFQFPHSVPDEGSTRKGVLSESEHRARSAKRHEPCKQHKLWISCIPLLFATAVTELGRHKFSQAEQQHFSQDKISLSAVSVYFKWQLPTFLCVKYLSAKMQSRQPTFCAVYRPFLNPELTIGRIKQAEILTRSLF